MSHHNSNSEEAQHPKQAILISIPCAWPYARDTANQIKEMMSPFYTVMIHIARPEGHPRSFAHLTDPNMSVIHVLLAEHIEYQRQKQSDAAEKREKEEIILEKRPDGSYAASPPPKEFTWQFKTILDPAQGSTAP